jgi:hypothetical protein
MTDDEQSATAKVERTRLSLMFTLFAVSRDFEATATGDARYIAAAGSIRQIVATLDQISDDVLLRLATVNELSEGRLLELITARVEQVGGALPCYPDAVAFFEPLVEQVDTILRNARQCLN